MRIIETLTSDNKDALKDKLSRMITHMLEVKQEEEMSFESIGDTNLALNYSSLSH